MTSTPTFRSLDDAQLWALEAIVENGRQVVVRGAGSVEVVGAHFAISEPRRRCVTLPLRKWSLPLAIGEFCWHLRGATAVDQLAYYAPRWSQFADPSGNVLGSCYGHKLFGGGSGPSQWDRTVALLRSHPSSRRAVLTLYDSGYGLVEEASDVACTSTLQFLVRDGMLHMLVTMRSNDAFLGLGYDVFFFTMLQELMAVTLGLGLGSYHHAAASLHVYDVHLARTRAVLGQPQPRQFEMPPMADVESLDAFLALEAAIRNGAWPRGLSALSGKAPYWADLAGVLSWFHLTSRGSAEPPTPVAVGPYEPLLRASGIGRRPLAVAV